MFLFSFLPRSCFVYFSVSGGLKLLVWLARKASANAPNIIGQKHQLCWVQYVGCFWIACWLIFAIETKTSSGCRLNIPCDIQRHPTCWDQQYWMLLVIGRLERASSNLLGLQWRKHVIEKACSDFKMTTIHFVHQKLQSSELSECIAQNAIVCHDMYLQRPQV